jgi:hypothetical protein
MMIEYWKERTVSLGTIRNISRNPSDCQGNNPTEIKRVIDYFGLPYTYVTGIDAAYIRKKLTNGYKPILVGVGYRAYPNKDNRCGPISAEIGGRNDCGFRGAHAVLACEERAHRGAKGKFLHHDIYMRDPDHGSPSRPARPNYDRIKRVQLQNTMRALVTDTSWNNTFAFVPTKKKHL